MKINLDQHKDIFTDLVLLASAPPKPKPSAPSPSGRYSFDVLIDATFASITLKQMVYTPAMLKRNVASVTSPYPIPFQLHHEDTQDAIGRIVAAKYIDLSKDFGPDAQALAKIKDTKSFIPHIKKLEALHKQDGFKGLSTIRMHAKISDPDAITKFMDGRYLTVSVGWNRPDDMFCSICGANVLLDSDEDDECEHQWGHKYDGEMARLVPDYKGIGELSVVNRPALPHAAAVALGKTLEDGISVEPQYFMQDDQFVYELRTGKSISLKDSLEAGITLSLLNEDVFAERMVIDTGEEEMKNKKSDPKIDPKTKDTQEPEKPAEGQKPEEETVDFDYDRDIASWLKENGEEDKVLTTEARKKLATGTFCGPDRSFPVPDKAHCRAALQRLSQGFPKGASSAAKARIKSCVMGKCKKMGVKVSGDSIVECAPILSEIINACPVDAYNKVFGSLPEDKKLTPDQLAALDEKEFVGANRTFPAVDELHVKTALEFLGTIPDGQSTTLFKLVKSGLEAKLAKLVEPEKSVEEPKPEDSAEPEKTKEDLEQENVDLREENAELKATLAMLEKQQAANDSLLAERDKTIGSLMNELKLRIVDAILGERKRLGLAGDLTRDALMERSPESLQDALKDLQATTVPGQLPKAEDPTLHVKSQNPDLKVQDKYAAVAETYKYLVEARGKIFADGYLQSMKAQRMVPADFRIE